jgi:hypothetical protein
MKSLQLEECSYIFETLEQLVEMLKDDDCKVALNIKEKGKIKQTVVRL